MGISYNPGIAYRGDQFLYQGLAGLGQSLGQALTDYQKKREEEKMKLEAQQAENQKNDIILSHYKDMGLLKPEEFSQYLDANGKQRSAMASGFGERIALDYAAKGAAAKQQAAATQDLLHRVQATRTVVDTNRIINPPPPPPLEVQKVPLQGGEPVNVLTGGGLKQPKVLPSTAPPVKMEVTEEDKANAARAGYTYLRQSDGSFIPKLDPDTPVGGMLLRAQAGQTDKPDSFKSFADDVNAMKDIMENPKVHLPGEAVNQIANSLVTRLSALSATKKKPDQTRMLPASDQKALDWALANPNDPRAASIKQRLGIR